MIKQQKEFIDFLADVREMEEGSLWLSRVQGGYMARVYDLCWKVCTSEFRMLITDITLNSASNVMIDSEAIKIYFNEDVYIALTMDEDRAELSIGYSEKVIT
jgi:NADPH-dependent 7-cyano-7-deazaguanine reductase QueF-like protein